MCSPFTEIEQAPDEEAEDGENDEDGSSQDKDRNTSTATFTVSIVMSVLAAIVLLAFLLKAKTYSKKSLAVRQVSMAASPHFHEPASARNPNDSL